MAESTPPIAESADAEWFEGGDGHGYRYQYIGPIHYLCECGAHFLNRDRWIAHKALSEAAEALNSEGLGFKSGGWGSNPADQQTIDVMVKAVNWLRERAADPRFPPEAGRTDG